MAEGDRDRTTKFSWAELSSLLTYLRQEVEEVRAEAGRGFDEALIKIRKPLERLAAHGGDPRFALVALVSARWRSVRSPGADIERGRRLLGRLAAEAELLKLLEGTVAPHFKSAVEESLKFLKSFPWQDRGVRQSGDSLAARGSAARILTRDTGGGRPRLAPSIRDHRAMAPAGAGGAASRWRWAAPVSSRRGSRGAGQPATRTDQG